MAVPNIFANVTTTIPLSQLDTNFATAITLGNTAVYLGNTTTALGNLTLNNVTIASGTASGNLSTGNVTVSGTLGVTGASTLAALSATTGTFTGGVDKLTTATGVVSVAASAAPTTGQVLTATSGTAATWQTSSAVNLASPGPIGGTTPGTGAFTTLSSTLDATIYGVTVGRGTGAVSGNTVVGYQAGYSTTTGTEKTALGYQAAYSSTTGDKITAIGKGAMYNTTTGDGTGIGANALYAQTTASGNTAVGGYSTSNVSALYSVTTGSYNIGMGVGSGTALTTGGSGVYLGCFTSASAGGANYEMVIGYNCTGKGSTTGFISPNGGGVYQGDNSSSWSVTSDQRLKKNIVDNNVGLEKITAIQVRNFEYRLPEEVDAELKHTDAIQNEGVQLGVIAQELQLVLPECVKTESTGVMSVNADNLTWYLVNAIKELDAKFEEYKSTHP